MQAFFLLLQTFYNLCIFRIGPQDLPASRAFLWVMMSSYLAVKVLNSLIEYPLPQAFLISLVEIALLLLLIGSLLHMTNRTERLLQALTAMAGTGILLNLVALPVQIWLQHAYIQRSGVALPGLLLLGLMIWSMLIDAHILRHTLSVSLITGIMLSLIMTIIMINVLQQLFS